MYAENPRLAYEIYDRAKTFGQLPSVVARLDDEAGDFGCECFDRGVWLFGREVIAAVEKAGQSSDPVLARMQREREWERLMGADMDNSTAGFADPGSAMAARESDQPDDDFELEL